MSHGRRGRLENARAAGLRARRSDLRQRRLDSQPRATTVTLSTEANARVVLGQLTGKDRNVRLETHWSGIRPAQECSRRAAADSGGTSLWLLTREP